VSLDVSDTMANLEIHPLDSPRNERLIPHHLSTAEASIQRPERVHEQPREYSSEQDLSDLEAGGHRPSTSQLDFNQNKSRS
jgi:hypothetical protein